MSAGAIGTQTAIPSRSWPWSSIVRWALAILVAAGAVSLIVPTIHLYTVGQQIINHELRLKDVPYNDLTKGSIDIKVDQAKAILQVSFVVLGVLWGLVIIKEGQAKIGRKDRPEMLMFLAANLAFVIQFACYLLFTDAVSSAYSAAGAIGGAKESWSIPDILSSSFGNLSWYQLWAWAVVIGAAGLTYFRRTT